ncbi:MAG: ATP-dependent Clp protease proteolytic subunit [bacterium]|nr:ATP-dependent Clp protease proteolytic subunit [bacterium]
MKIPWGNAPVNLVSPWDIFERDSRIVTLFGPVRSVSSVNLVSDRSTSFLAEDMFGALVMLGMESKEPVKIVINSVGGDVTAGFTIIQAIEHLKNKGIEVWTINILSAMSMAGVILIAGTKGKRFTLRNSTVHAHCGMISAGKGKPTDIEYTQEYLKSITKKLESFISENSRIPEFYAPEHYSKDSLDDFDEATLNEIATNKKTRLNLINRFLENERYLSPDQAKKAGMIDEVIEPGDAMLDEIFRASAKAINRQGEQR